MLFMLRLSSDLTTKARNTRRRFQQLLVRNLQDALESFDIPYTLQRAWSRLYVDTPDPRAVGVLTRVFGIQSLSPVSPKPLTTLEALVQDGVKLYRERVRGRRYAVRARRAEETPFSSMDIQVALGAALNREATVDLDHPEVTVNVELRDGKVYFFSEQLPGAGGLPLGAQASAVALLSGGFDSAVAAWMVLKRGVPLDYVFCRLGGAAHERDVLRVAKALALNWSYGTHPKLYVVPFEPLVSAIQGRVATPYWQLVLKRRMYRVAAAIASQQGASGIVTGEALGQVSSQTLSNLYALDLRPRPGEPPPPLLRPLLGFDKEEIIGLARKIGTEALSAHVPEHCALVPRHPAIAANPETLDAEEAKLNADADPDMMLQSVRVFDLRQTPAETLTDHPQYLTDQIPPDAIILDIRPRSDFEAWHHPDAIHAEFAEILDDFPRRLDPSATYLIYCDWGLKSAHLAERMQKAGYKAYAFKGGLRELRRCLLSCPSED